MPIPRVFIHIIRRDIRVGDNPITHHVSTHADLYDLYLPVFVFSSHQIELSGFIKDKSPNPFPPAKSAVAGYWRTGPHRVKFVAEAVWALKNHLESLGSGLVVRVGKIADTVRALALGLADAGQKVEVGAIWMTSHEGSEEKKDEREVEALCREIGAEFTLQVDEKYLIDDRDVKLDAMDDLPDVFTTYRKNQEPLHEKPRAVLPAPAKGSLPRFPDISSIPAQPVPFTIPGTLEDFIDALVTPVKNFLPKIPPFPKSAVSAHPFKGGEEAGHARLAGFIKSGGMSKYKDTRNGLLGSEFSTKLSAYLAQGCITARQIHHMLLGFENGTDPRFEDVEGYGKGENDGTQAVRFELLWRDYMRLCHRKFGDKFFRLEGFRFTYQQKVDGETPKSKQWKFPSKDKAPDDQVPAPDQIAEFLERFNAGTTGMGLIDASQRELMHTGYTSNRARQNVASFLAKHLDIDWRYGAEWYEMLLVDYDVSSNWANWQYVSGIGNDPRGDIRIFNPVKQAFDYDKEGKYVRSWVPELSKLERLEHVFQVCSAKDEDAESAGLAEDPMYTNPVKKITFVVGASPRVYKKGTYRRGGRRGAPAVGRAGRLGRSTANGADSAESSGPPGSRCSGGAPLNIDVRTTAYFAQAQRVKDTRPKDVSPPVIANGTLKSFNAGASRSFFRPTGSSQAQRGGVGSSRPSRGMSDRGRHGGSHQSTVHQSQAQQSGA